MSATPRSIYPALLLLLAIGTVYLAMNWIPISRSCEKGADHELMGIAVELASEGNALTGPYSRFGFRHPGPVMAYYYAAWEALLTSLNSDITPMGSHLIGQVALNLFWIGLAIWWMWSLSPRARSLSPLAIPVILLVWSNTGRPFLHDYWNPSVTMGAMLGLICSLSLVGGGSSGALPFAVGASVVLVHSHVGTIPLVALAWSILILRSFFSRVQPWSASRDLRKGPWAISSSSFLLSLAIAGTGLLPILWESLIAPDYGNLGKLSSVLSAETSVATWIDGVTRTAHYFDVFGTGYPVLSLVAVLSFLLLTRHSSAPAQKDATFLVISLTLCSFILTRHTRGEWDPYLLRSMYGVVAVASLLILVQVADLVSSDRIRSPLTRLGVLVGQPLPRRTFPLLTVSLLRVPLFSVPFILAGTASVLLLSSGFKPPPQKCGSIARPFLRVLKREPTRTYRLVIGDHAAWPFAAPLALALLRNDFSLCVDPEWRYLFDTALVCTESQRKWPRLVVYRSVPEPLPPEVAALESFKGPLNTIFWGLSD